MSGTIRRQYLTSGIAKTDYRWRKRSKPRYMPHSCSALRKSEYLTTNEPTPPSSSARILRRRSVSSFNRNNARIPYQRIGHLPVHSIRLVIDFSKTDQLGLGRLLIHCRQDETDVNCIVSIMKNWIVSTWDQYELSESSPVRTIADYPKLTGDVIYEVMKSTCDLIGLPRSQVSSHYHDPKIRRGYRISRSRIPAIHHSYVRWMDREFQSHAHLYAVIH